MFSSETIFMCMILQLYIYICLVKYVYSIITSAPIIVNKVVKLLYYCTYLSPLPSLSVPPQPLILNPLPLFISSLALLCYMCTLLVKFSCLQEE